jgi:hypothetical protein
MRRRSLLFVASFLCFGPLMSASPITYSVTVNTSSVSGTAGSLDFQFDPGPFVSQPASLQILAFAGNGTLAGTPSVTGDISGALPTTVTFDNGSGFNDYFQDFTFGSTLLFSVSLYGPGLTSPNGTATSGSTFAFSMFSDAAGTVPVLTTDLTDGFAFEVDVNLVGTATITNFSAQTTVSAGTSSAPEPSSFVFIGALLGVFTLVRTMWAPSPVLSWVRVAPGAAHSEGWAGRFLSAGPRHG